MVIDTSALVAVLFEEPEAEALRPAIEKDPVRLVSAASLLETAIVVHSRVGDAGGQALDLVVHRARLQVVAVDAEQVEVARHAHRTYGKGFRPAGLNFGDCFGYALSRVSGEPLLFKGDDFARTDIERVVTE